VTRGQHFKTGFEGLRPALTSWAPPSRPSYRKSLHPQDSFPKHHCPRSLKMDSNQESSRRKVRLRKGGAPGWRVCRGLTNTVPSWGCEDRSPPHRPAQGRVSPGLWAGHLALCPPRFSWTLRCERQWVGRLPLPPRDNRHQRDSEKWPFLFC
jgi:hypothetical protein